jgi:hypothetical protein
MKTTILIITLFCSICILNSYSQPEKGTYMLGGGASTSIDFYNGYNSFNISLYPDIGYFFSDNFAMGASLPLNVNIHEGYRNFGYGITPFFRYYFGPASDIMYFVTGAVGIRGLTSKYNDSSSSSSGVTGSAGAGGTYFLNRSIGLEVILGYTYSKWNESDASSDIDLSIGFQIYF